MSRVGVKQNLDDGLGIALIRPHFRNFLPSKKKMKRVSTGMKIVAASLS